MFAENDGPIFWKKGLSKFQANFSDWWLGHLLWNGPQMNFAGPTSPLALMYDVPVSFSIYMKQVTQLIDVPIGVAEKSPWLDL